MICDDCKEREQERGEKRQGEGEGGREGERERGREGETPAPPSLALSVCYSRPPMPFFL